MRLVVNGRPTELDDGTTIVDVLVAMGRDVSARGVAVALNGEVVPKGQWKTTEVGDGDRIEVLSAVGGG